MRDPIALSVVIPAYNEERRLPATLRDLQAFLDRDGRRAEVIVVDDGSTDGTSDAVRRAALDDARVRLIRLPQNRGKGYAVRTGVVNAAGRLVLFADADGATPFGELARLEEHLRNGARVAIGSRALRDAQTRVEARIYRRIAGRMFHAVVRLSAIRGFTDTQCGFKLFEASTAQDLFSRMRMTGYSFDVELLLMATRAGYKALGKDPARYRGSAEALLRRLIAGKGLPRINSVVDVINLVSVESRLPIGLYDLAQVEGAIEFRPGCAGETYKGIGKYDLNLEGLPLFADAKGPHGSATSDSERTMVTEKTNCVLAILVSVDGPNRLEQWTQKLSGLFAAYCAAKAIETRIIP